MPMPEGRRAGVDAVLFVGSWSLAALTWGAVAWRWELPPYYLVVAFLLQLSFPHRDRLQTWVLAGSAPVLIQVLYQGSLTLAGVIHVLGLGVGSLIPGLWLAHFVRRNPQRSHAV